MLVVAIISLSAGLLLLVLGILLTVEARRQAERGQSMQKFEFAQSGLVLSWSSHPNHYLRDGQVSWNLLRGPRTPQPADHQALALARQRCTEVYGRDAQVLRIYRLAPGDWHAVCGPLVSAHLAPVIELETYRTRRGERTE